LPQLIVETTNLFLKMAALKYGLKYSVLNVDDINVYYGPNLIKLLGAYLGA